jgi:hypothetical protein
MNSLLRICTGLSILVASLWAQSNSSAPGLWGTINGSPIPDRVLNIQRDQAVPDFVRKHGQYLDQKRAEWWRSQVSKLKVALSEPSLITACRLEKMGVSVLAGE